MFDRFRKQEAFVLEAKIALQGTATNNILKEELGCEVCRNSSRDDTANATCTGQQRAIQRTWRTSDWEEVLVLKLRQGGISSLAISSDGKLIVSGGISDHALQSRPLFAR